MFPCLKILMGKKVTEGFLVKRRGGPGRLFKTTEAPPETPAGLQSTDHYNP